MIDAVDPDYFQQSSCTVWTLEPNSLREAGLSSIVELPTVRGGELVWACI